MADVAVLALVGRVIVQQSGRGVASLWLLGAAAVAVLLIDLAVSVMGDGDGAMSVRVAQAILVFIVLLAVASAAAARESRDPVLPIPAASLHHAGIPTGFMPGIALVAMPATLAYAVVVGAPSATPVVIALFTAAAVLAVLRVVFMIRQARLAAGAEARAAERKRIELDLHDGLQQHLVAMRQRLGVLDHVVSTPGDDSREAVEELIVQTELALSELRALAAGRHPATLTRRGLAAALRETTGRLPFVVNVNSAGLVRGQATPEVEAAVYFCCLEGVQNAMKHGDTSRPVTIDLRVAGPDLMFTIADGAAASTRDEVPAAPPWTMVERVERLHGQVLASRTDGGMTVRGQVPLASTA